MLSWDNIKTALEYEAVNGYWERERSYYSESDRAAIESMREACNAVSYSEPKGTGQDLTYTNYVYGWRTWGINNFMLTGVGNSHPWNARTLHAVCTRHKNRRDYDEGVEHIAPMPDCGCGIWSVKNHFVNDVCMQYARAKIVGIVAHWGTIVHHEHGYRSEYAQIIQMWYMKDKGEDFKHAESIVGFFESMYETPMAIIGRQCIKDPVLPFGLTEFMEEF